MDCLQLIILWVLCISAMACNCDVLYTKKDDNSRPLTGDFSRGLDVHK